jgi:hypothetical protein
MPELPQLEQAVADLLALEHGYLAIAESQLTTSSTEIVVRYHLLEGRGNVTSSSTNQKLHFPAIPAKTPGVYIFERWEDHGVAGVNEEWRAHQIYVGEAESIRERWSDYRKKARPHEEGIRSWMQNWLAANDGRRQIRIHLVLWAEVRTPDGLVLASRITTMEQRVLRRLVEGAVLAGRQKSLEEEFEMERPRNFNKLAMKLPDDEVLFFDDVAP